MIWTAPARLFGGTVEVSYRACQYGRCTFALASTHRQGGFSPLTLNVKLLAAALSSTCLRTKLSSRQSIACIAGEWTRKLTGSPLVPRQFRLRSQFRPGSRQSSNTTGSREVSSIGHMSHHQEREGGRTVRVCHRKGLVRVLNACVGWFRLKI
mgnify:CR=1 FL=1